MAATVEPRVTRALGETDGDMSAAALRHQFQLHLRHSLAKDRYSATDRDRIMPLALTVRDQLIDRWIATQQMHHKKNVKRVYYLSLEFLIGRLLGNNVINLRIEDVYRTAMSQEGLDYEALREYEVDAGLGNGGLGRLAACFLDSIATLNLPAIGYGLRYDFGIFKQQVVNGYQVEQPDEWLKLRYPWEFAHPEFSFEVQFEGRAAAGPVPTATNGIGPTPSGSSACPTICPSSGTAPRPSTRCACGRQRRPKISTWTTSTAASTWTRWRTKSAPKT